MSKNVMQPKLRQLDIRPISHQGRPSLLVRDPLELSERYLILPQALGPALMLMDGEHEIEGMYDAMHRRWGIRLERGVLDELAAALDGALMLENDAAHEVMVAAIAAYRAAPFRAPSIAGNGYPAEPDELKTLFDEYLASAPPANGTAKQGRGLISPHIDYQRGGQVYARVWKEAAAMAREAELVIVFGTDHQAGRNLLTLTRQNYATPYGILPTDLGLVDAVAAAIGEEQAYAGELYHRNEHSIELVVTWLHHMRGGEPAMLLPILTGSFQPFMGNGHSPKANHALRAALDTIRAHTANRNVLVVASGDLAHIGPAFGGDPIDIIERAELRAHDDELIAHLANGDAEGFWRFICRVEDARNVCGVSPFYLSMHLMGQVEGQRAGYAVCPADSQSTSVVSVCGMVFG
ncbi:MAG: AmmeMemoRadiSam system protein B [Caldilineales bacterium]|nr:AmmeMemoRadiSam system protein B [Caldilineales bacterium]